MKRPLIIGLSAALAVLTLSGEPQFGIFSRSASFFIPTNRLSGIGVDREQLSDLVLEKRTELMIRNQTFGILRDPRSVQGAERVNSPRLQKIFEQASRDSGLPSSLIAAVAYLESWGESDAVSPAGPKGIMQFSEATARMRGLRIIRATHYRVTSTRVQVKKKRGKTAWKTVKRRVPYTVLVRDERMIPELAVPAAARYLKYMEQKFGGIDWAVFAYHCGEGCVGDVRELVRSKPGFDGEKLTVSRLFFSGSPAHNREIYETIRYHMSRDFSPTYWFRIKRAQQLLQLHKEDPEEFRKLAEQYRNLDDPSRRAPHRLSVWLRPEEAVYQTCDDIRRDLGTRLVRAMDNPGYFGFAIRPNGVPSSSKDLEAYMAASPAALGTLSYIAFEARRLHEAMKPKGEKFVPLTVTALVKPMSDLEKGRSKVESHSHCTGHVFDIALDDLPRGQREALHFVLSDMGWDGYLGFVEESPDSNTLHIGCAPTAREFFARIYDEAVEAARKLTD
jgi:hypothetical protein